VGDEPEFRIEVIITCWVIVHIGLQKCVGQLLWSTVGMRIVGAVEVFLKNCPNPTLQSQIPL
jgi:hypothetical protein